MIEFSFPEAARAIGADFEGDLPSGPFPSVSIDSRTVESGQCFIAVRGNRLDGHDFIPQALERGASVLVVSRPFLELSRWPGRLQLRVAETTEALQQLGSLARRRWGCPLVAVTGSMGKTTTRQFTAALLGQSFQAFQSPGNFNNEFGLPLSLLGLEARHQMAVLELGMNHAGEIRALSRICAPDAAVITNVAAVHLEFFSDVDAIAEAKGEILENLPPDGRFFYNADDWRVAALARRHPGRKVSFSVDAAADVRVARFHFDSLERMEFELEAGGRRLGALVPFAGRHFLYNICAAVSVALEFGVPLERVEAGLAGLRPSEMRGRLRRFRGATVWDDSYNSNPQALLAVLDTVGRLAGFRRKILALGEMRELGPSSSRLHRQSGREAAARADFLVTVGADAAELARGALEAGLAPEQTAHFPCSREAAEFLIEYLVPGDFLLVKGSRGARMDRIIEKFEEIEPA